MPNEKNFWTQKRDDGKWETKQEGASRASRTFDTQAESWDYTKQRAQDSKGEAFLKGRDNQIRERNTYGDDPHPPKG
jgi:hypothetical protein